MIPRLGDDPASLFPPASAALEEPDGLLAWGGDLTPGRLEAAYHAGIFPWHSESDPILWWCPSVRCVFDTGRLHVSHSLGRLLRQQRFAVTADRAFDAVIDGCVRGRSETWITDEMHAAYCEMHHLGHGHSIEVWDGEELVGGLYGLAFGRMFFGESMYSAARDASKVALVSLCRVLHRWDIPWLDSQVTNPHLLRMGARLIQRERFLGELARLVNREGRVGPWTDAFAATLADEPPGA